MAKVYAIHPLELKPGVSGADLEQFLAGEGAPLLEGQGGATFSLLKGDRGARAGQYAWLSEYPNVEARDALFPVADVPLTEGLESIPEPLRSLFMKLLGMVAGLGEPATYTDYVAVAE
jgi:hypothetical protein